MNQSNDCYTSFIVPFSCCVLLILSSSVSLDVASCFFFRISSFFSLSVFAGGVGYYSMWFFCSIYPRTINACWLFGPQGSHAYVFLMHCCLNPESADCVCVCVCVCLSLHVSVFLVDVIVSVFMPFLFFFFFPDVYGHLRAHFCVRECVRCCSGRVCSLFMDCKEVLSVSV